MILAVDVGNTETLLGLYEDSEVRRSWRISTQRHPTGDEMALMLRGLLASELQQGEVIERAVIASVVPAIDRSWDEALAALGIPTRRIDASTPLPVTLDVDEPASVGADRIVNTLGTSCLYGRDTVVVDLGTATTFDCITAEGVFLGGVIAPGPRAGIDRLHEFTSKLPSVEIRVPRAVIGRRTETCLESGVFYSIVDGIDGLVRRILEEWGPEDPLVIATGGLAEVIAPHCRTVEMVDPYLTLHGLICADQYLEQEDTSP
ncbi:MAG: type III pantothenate kinase [Candidatus Palauibacterales bacterium]|jgi:type III pantothenate kinase|nr:type III pantothenate kinase [Candidatus Palauibacterales bacterium]MDP2483655.1 type III pantothenate kinase [Candidatus Palauibacterales bacterium]